MDSSHNKVFIGRQAIYDRDGNTFGYELLHRSSNKSTADFSDADKASSDVLLNTFVEIGLEQLTGPHKAFINLTRKFFVDMPPLPFEPDKVVLELHEDIEVDQKLIESVASYHQKGFALAIDDFVFEEKWTSLLPYLYMIKVDIPQVDLEQYGERIQQLKQYPLKLLAEKVETEEEYLTLRELGFDFFQGYYFSRPKIIESKTIAENELIILQLLTRLSDPEVSIEELDQLIAQDPALSYKILRYINSAAVGLGRKVDSIRQAVIYMGLTRIKAWVSLLAMSGVHADNQDILLNAIVRAFMCQSLANKSQTINPDTAFTVGTLSILDTLMQVPMQTILEKLPVSNEIKSALLGREGKLGEALNCAIAYEMLDWDSAKFTGCDVDFLNEAFANSSHEGFRAVMGLNES